MLCSFGLERESGTLFCSQENIGGVCSLPSAAVPRFLERIPENFVKLRQGRLCFEPFCTSERSGKG